MQREKIGVVGEFQIAALVDTTTDTIAAYEIRDGAGLVRGTFAAAHKDEAFRKLRRLVSGDQGCLAVEGVCAVCAQTRQGETTYVVRAGQKVFSYDSRKKAMEFFSKETRRRQPQSADWSASTA